MAGLQPGDLVRARGDCWRVAGLSAYVDCEALHLDGIDATNRGLRRTLLLPFDRPARLHRSSHLRVVRRTAWYRAFRALARDHALHDSLQTAASARINLLAYQLEPALAVLRGQASRLLLADEVGLGKTSRPASAISGPASCPAASTSPQPSSTGRFCVRSSPLSHAV